MKRIEAIVRREKVADVLSAVRPLPLGGVTSRDVLGHGVQGGVHERWRGEIYTADLLPKTLLTLVVEEEDLSEALETIVAVARTGRLGDGKVFVSDVEGALRVRTGERDDTALGRPDGSGGGSGR